MLFKDEKIALYLPFLYTLYSRGGVFSIINNYLYGPTIIILYAFFFKDLTVSFQTAIFIAFISYLLFYLVYEIGYIINDLWSIKTENKPVERTKKVDFSIKKILGFILIRLLTIGIIFTFIFFSSLVPVFFFNIYSTLLGVVLLIYIFHNFIHLFNIRFRIVSFTLLKISFWFVPSSFFFLFLDKSEKILFSFTFLGAMSFYLYSYTVTKKWWSGFKFSLPYSLESRLLLFIAPFLALSFFLSYSVYLQFTLFVCGYFLGFAILRTIGRYLK